MSNAIAPGWYTDPHFASALRWWDGNTWTEHTAPAYASTTASVQSPVADGQPAAASLRPPDLSTVVNALRANPAYTEPLRQSLTRRQPATLVGALSFGAGTLMAVGFILLFTGADSPWLFVLCGLMLMVGGWALAIGLRMAGVPHIGSRALELIPVGTVLAGVGAFVFAGALVAVMVMSGLPQETWEGGGLPGWSLWVGLLLTAMVLFGLWMLPGLQGRPALLGASLSFFGQAAATLVGVTIAGDRLQDGGSASSQYIDSAELQAIAQRMASGASATALLCGLIFMIATLLLDSIGWKGVATPVLVAGWINLLSGTTFIALSPGPVIAILLTGVLILVITVGALGRRRATMWIGAGMTPIALFSGVAAVFGEGGNFAATGVVCGVVGFMIAGAGVAAMLWGPEVRTRYDRFATERASQVPEVLLA